MTWLQSFADEAQRTDRLLGRSNHSLLLSAGFIGEIGGLLTELKKAAREREAYPAYRQRLTEEFGDALWYLTRLTTVVSEQLLRKLPPPPRPVGGQDASLHTFLSLATSGAALAQAVADSNGARQVAALQDAWASFTDAAAQSSTSLEEAQRMNLAKIRSRWPAERTPVTGLDAAFPPEERFPNHLTLDFVERKVANRTVAVLRCNGLNFGDRLSDNIGEADGYRFHDVFHFTYAVHLGWSPVTRALLRCKRKSVPAIDENEDGARAVILEEAIAAAVFTRARQLGYFDGIDHVDYDLLKLIGSLTRGYEVDRVPLWQWEEAILRGYQLFRQLLTNGGGRLTLHFPRRELHFIAANSLA